MRNCLATRFPQRHKRCRWAFRLSFFRNGQLGVGVKYPQESLDVDGNIKFAERTFAAGEKEPSDGRWNTGSVVWNEKPELNNPVGWVCIRGGKPGSWRPFGLIY